MVALLRGINVGGRHKVAMADLRDVAASLGFDNPITFIQSGNLVFDTDLDQAAIVTALDDALEDRFGFEVPVVVRSAAELGAVADAYLLARPDSDPKLLMVAFLDQVPAMDVASVIDAADYLPDRFVAADRDIYLDYPNGSARSKLNQALLEQRLGVRATLRNWNTILKVLGLVQCG